MLTRIRNAQMRRKKTKVSTPASTLRARVLDVLKSEGFIRGYSEVKIDNGKSRDRDRAQVLRRPAGDPRDRARLAPGRRVYASVKKIPPVANGLGVSILSTPKGVMADHEAQRQNVGGEVLCRVF